MEHIPNFWDNTHPLSAQASELYSELVPSSGNCQTLQGELLRASSKIGYDWYNNGWGCNNWSGAVIFLRDHISDLPNTVAEESERQEFFSALRLVHQYSHGEPCGISDEAADRLVTTIHEYVVKKVMATWQPIPNKLDMWDFSEPDYVPVNDHDDDWDDLHF